MSVLIMQGVKSPFTASNKMSSFRSAQLHTLYDAMDWCVSKVLCLAMTCCYGRLTFAWLLCNLFNLPCLRLQQANTNVCGGYIINLTLGPHRVSQLVSC